MTLDLVYTSGLFAGSMTRSASSSDSLKTWIEPLCSLKTPRMSFVDALPSRSQMALGGGPFRNANWRKSESFETITKPCSPAYDQISLSVAASRPTSDVAAISELLSKLANKVARQVLVEQQFHAGVARRRSRIAAKPIAARTWSSDSSGKSATISPLVIPDAR